MNIKTEPNLEVNTSNGEVYEADIPGKLIQYPLDEYNSQYIKHERPAGLSTDIKQEVNDLSAYACMNIPQDVLDIKEETIQINETHPKFIPNINKLVRDETIFLHSVVDSKSNKEKKYYKCSKCSHLFSHPYQLVRHLMVHTGEKPYSCSWCDYKSIQKVNLTSHIRRNHTGEKPYSCTICDFKSVTNYQIIRHVRTHTGEKPFSCSSCDYRCARKVDLTRHMKTHTGEKPFSCTICDQRYADKRDLTHHVRNHTGEKPFSCSFCNYKCVKKSYLKRHVIVHTGEKPFCCTLCSYKCSRKSFLYGHLKNHAEGKRVRKGKRLKTPRNAALEKCHIEEPEGNLVEIQIDNTRLLKIKVEEVV